MIRDYDSGEDSEVAIFTGKEIERSPAYGLDTLFVVGIHDVDKIKRYAAAHSCKHIYLGANMSFNGKDLDKWERMSRKLLESKLWVTLDFDIQYTNDIHEMGLDEFHTFIPMVSAKLPNVRQLGYNTCLKIDDRGFAESNPGVWVWAVHELMDRSRFTSWDKYGTDWIVEYTQEDPK